MVARRCKTTWLRRWLRSGSVVNVGELGFHLGLPGALVAVRRHCPGRTCALRRDSWCVLEGRRHSTWSRSSSTIGSSATLGADHTSSVSVSPSSMSRFRSVFVCCPSLSVLVGRDLVLGHTVSTVYRRCYDSGKTYPALLVCRPVVRVLSVVVLLWRSESTFTLLSVYCRRTLRVSQVVFTVSVFIFYFFIFS